MLIILGVAFVQQGMSQSYVSGSLEANTRFFLRDSTIGATGIPQYDNLLTGSEAWLTAKYSNRDWDLNAGIRLDVYNNSNLIDPTSAYTGIGIGRWYIEKEIAELTVTGGYIYDQFGSGITLRAYEERALAIDNALFGVMAKYQFGKNWWVKALTGKQKNRFDTYEPIIRGGNTEGFLQIADDISLAPGASLVNRTLDQQNMDIIVSTIESYPADERFVPTYNVFAYSLYNRLNFKNFAWYLEYAGKSSEAILNPEGVLVDEPGSVIYTTLDYSRKGLGVTAQYKRTEHFELRTSPNQTLNDGLITFLPPMARANTFTLPARYNAATQFLGEQAVQLDIYGKPNRTIDFKFTGSYINNLQNDRLFRELYGEVTYKKGRDWKLLVGGQYLNYNQMVYEQKGDSMLTSIVPFAEFLYRFDRKKSLRAEVQYMHNKEDYGSWIFGLVEFNIAPKWSFAVTDMYNVDPLKTAEDLHYPTVLASYRDRGNRFTLAFVKQVEGIVCTGGVCRYEPAFSGVRFTISSTF